jgi:hypothetical protein
LEEGIEELNGDETSNNFALKGRGGCGVKGSDFGGEVVPALEEFMSERSRWCREAKGGKGNRVRRVGLFTEGAGVKSEVEVGRVVLDACETVHPFEGTVIKGAGREPREEREGDVQVGVGVVGDFREEEVTGGFADYRCSAVERKGL